MSILIQNNSIFKKESTAQTYGQLVMVPSQNTSFGIQNQSNANTPKDISITLTPDKSVSSLNLATLNDIDRSKISIAAFSTVANKFVNVTINNILPIFSNQKPDTINISNVYANSPHVAIVVGSAYKTPDDLAPIIAKSANVDIDITLKSMYSEVVEYNSLQQLPLNSASFTYRILYSARD
jgi:hypothetical protein